MQPGLAAVGSGPARFWPVQAHTGAGAIEMHLIFRLEEGAHVLFGEEVWRAVRSDQNANHPVRGKLRPQLPGQWLRRRSPRSVTVEPQHIAGAQRAGGMSAEAPECEGGPAAEVEWRIETVAQRECRAVACTLHGAHGENLTSLHRHRLVKRHRNAV